MRKLSFPAYTLAIIIVVQFDSCRHHSADPDAVGVDIPRVVPGADAVVELRRNCGFANRPSLLRCGAAREKKKACRHHRSYCSFHCHLP